MKKTLKIIFIICIALILTNTISYAEQEYSFIEIKSNTNPIYILYGFFILAYLIVQFVFYKKYKKVSIFNIINIILVLLILISKIILENLFLELLILMIILIAGLSYQKKLVKKTDSPEVIMKRYKNFKIIIVILSLILFMLTIYRGIENLRPKVYVSIVEYSHGRRMNDNTYIEQIIEGEYVNNAKFDLKILEIDNDGVLIEYSKGYYDKNTDLSMKKEYVYKTKRIQQKMLWDITYSYEYPKEPPEAPGETKMMMNYSENYYVRFEK